MKQTKAEAICGWCGRPTTWIWVHGHAQCAHCKINAQPCCQGGPTDPGCS